MILGQNCFSSENLRHFFVISEMYYKIMIWANVTKFGQNFIAPPKFFGLVRLWSVVDINSILLQF